MSLTAEMVHMLKQFIEGVTDAGGFSFDFPARLSFVFGELEKENEDLANLLDGLTEACGDYEPDEETRKEHPKWYVSEQQLRDKVSEVYEQAQRLI